MGEKGLSVGVHIWESLAHSCPLSACLRMDLAGTGREGLVRTGGRKSRRERETAQRAGEGLGKRHPDALAPRRRTSAHSVLPTLLVLPQTG